jgi:hypothetical protein
VTIPVPTRGWSSDPGASFGLSRFGGQLHRLYGSAEKNEVQWGVWWRWRQEQDWSQILGRNVKSLMELYPGGGEVIGHAKNAEVGPNPAGNLSAAEPT